MPSCPTSTPELVRANGLFTPSWPPPSRGRDSWNVGRIGYPTRRRSAASLMWGKLPNSVNHRDGTGAGKTHFQNLVVGVPAFGTHHSSAWNASFQRLERTFPKLGTHRDVGQVGNLPHIFPRLETAPTGPAPRPAPSPAGAVGRPAPAYPARRGTGPGGACRRPVPWPGGSSGPVATSAENPR